ncbi:twin-arginine translocation signal domain-containing protein [Tautonia plasticadhaerens]|uniref:NHL repeat protein n=1 Tax=Tautonia plasticadhaerens TaxID=2527974 RepID=A0A518GY32_9BACT|nr:twin-arginine translocation signal domain-containing protein [Tautonia plasticadhaerens]QDV33473.1 NHL repeat protein [Tautonia plasticadhaerens]
MTASNLSRRAFLQAAGAAGLSAAASPHARGTQDRGAPVVGEGDYQYECHHDWGAKPDHIEWYETHGVAVDKDGMIYVTHRAGPDRPSSPAMAQDTVVVFDPEGKFVRSFGKEYHGGGHGIDIHEEDGREFLYLAFMFPINLVVKADLNGEVVWVKEKPVEPGVYADPEARYSPTNVAFSPDGGFYVCDGYGSNYIHQYDKKGEWTRTWGGTGTEPGLMRTPHGIWFDDRAGREPDVVVADRANARLQYFSPEGQFRSIVDEVSFPAHFDTRDDVLLVPDLHARVSLFDRDNNVITHLGDDPQWTAEVLDGFKVRVEPDRWRPGHFVHPHDACFDAEGNIFVAEWVLPGRLTKLRRLS